MLKIIDEFNGEYYFLSNFSNWKCEFEGLLYPTSEHAFQAAKSLSYGERIKISHLKTPGEAKKYGRNIILREDWDSVKNGVMFNILLDKFTKHKELFYKLLKTKDAELIEGNTWHDNYWGDCICEKCSKKFGQNNLGRTLMRIRNRFFRIIK
ncbi:MAG: NADAR family protein [Atribacterota bacterium]